MNIVVLILVQKIVSNYFLLPDHYKFPLYGLSFLGAKVPENLIHYFDLFLPRESVILSDILKL